MNNSKFLILLLILSVAGCRNKSGSERRTPDSLSVAPPRADTAAVVKSDTLPPPAPPANTTVSAPSGLPLESARVPFAGKFAADDPPDYAAGINAYRADSFAVAVRHLRAASRDQKLDWQIWFYLGISEYFAGNTREAIHALSTVDKLGPHPAYGLKARWYLANAYLMENNVVRAERILGSIVAQGKDYHSEAEGLLSRMKALPDSLRKKGN